MLFNWVRPGPAYSPSVAAATAEPPAIALCTAADVGRESPFRITSRPSASTVNSPRPVDHFDCDARVVPQRGRHTGGVVLDRASDRAPADRHLLHGTPSLRVFSGGLRLDHFLIAAVKMHWAGGVARAVDRDLKGHAALRAAIPLALLRLADALIFSLPRVSSSSCHCAVLPAVTVRSTDQGCKMSTAGPRSASV